MLLLDEITVDLDVVGRLQLLQFFREECEQRGATILYATHIFDGLEGWITHLAYMEDGRIIKGASDGRSVCALFRCALHGGCHPRRVWPGGGETLLARRGRCVLHAGGQVGQIPEVAQAVAKGDKLLHVVEQWLRTERDQRHQKQQQQQKAGQGTAEPTVRPNRTPYMPSKHLAFFR